MTLTPEQRAIHAKNILEDEVFVEAVAMIEQEAIRAIRNAPDTDALISARAKLVVVADIQKALEVIRDRQFITARSEPRAPLA